MEKDIKFEKKFVGGYAIILSSFGAINLKNKIVRCPGYMFDVLIYLYYKKNKSYVIDITLISNKLKTNNEKFDENMSPASVWIDFDLDPFDGDVKSAVIDKVKRYTAIKQFDEFREVRFLLAR